MLDVLVEGPAVSLVLKVAEYFLPNPEVVVLTKIQHKKRSVNFQIQQTEQIQACGQAGLEVLVKGPAVILYTRVGLPLF